MAERLDGTVALVTGASSGIGQACARGLAAAGATVALAARRKDRLEQLASEIDESGGQALVLPADVTDRAEAQRVVDRITSELGRLDTVINNAGVMLLGPAVDAPLEEWERMTALNALGLMYVAHAAIPHLLEAASSGERGVADLVNISSVAGRRGLSGGAAYSFTKFGVIGFSEGLRQELTNQHVRVSVIEPGAVATELATHLRPEVADATAHLFDGVEVLRAEDVAETVEFVVTRPRRASVDEVLIRPTNGF